MSTNFNMTGKRKLFAFYGGFIGVLYGNSAGFIPVDDVVILLQTLFGLFFGANVIGDRGKDVLNKYMDVMVKRIEAGSKS